MKQTITTREYDDEGRCVKETVVEHDYALSLGSCTCSQSGTWCPQHQRLARPYPGYSYTVMSVPTDTQPQRRLMNASRSGS